VNRVDTSAKLWYLAPIGVLAVLLTALLITLSPPETHGGVLKSLIRGAALLAYQLVFLSIVSSAYLRQMLRWFGHPFIRVHHILSVTGLVLVALHPIGVAWDNQSLNVFVPVIGSWVSFFSTGGRVAWVLLALGVLAALLRKRIGQSWRVIHYLNYAAFWLVSAHALLLGTNTQRLVVRIVVVAMCVAIAAVFIQKRLLARKRQTAKPGKLRPANPV
jgi:methionine sulfoxide reductase heme-binding subunit